MENIELEVKDRPNIYKHRLVGFLNEMSNKVKAGTIHVWDGKQFVCYGWRDGQTFTGWVRL